MLLLDTVFFYNTFIILHLHVMKVDKISFWKMKTWLCTKSFWQTFTIRRCGVHCHYNKDFVFVFDGEINEKYA